MTSGSSLSYFLITASLKQTLGVRFLFLPPSKLAQYLVCRRFSRNKTELSYLIALNTEYKILYYLEAI